MKGNKQQIDKKLNKHAGKFAKMHNNELMSIMDVGGRYRTKDDTASKKYGGRTLLKTITIRQWIKKNSTSKHKSKKCSS